MKNKYELKKAGRIQIDGGARKTQVLTGDITIFPPIPLYTLLIALTDIKKNLNESSRILIGDILNRGHKLNTTNFITTVC